MPTVTHHSQCLPYTTRDGSTIRELMHPQQHGNHMQSLAEAGVPPGTRTLLHRHHQSEELYHILEGAGVMTLGEERFEVSGGDTVLIPPGTAHAIENSGKVPLKLLCCCAPPYAHEDTELL
ncbi:MAG: cupin domain-containing protein [Chromatiales bacterium]|nr:cupin domain-containing protein [Chromatiales bacterium]